MVEVNRSLVEYNGNFAGSFLTITFFYVGETVMDTGVPRGGPAVMSESHPLNPHGVHFVAW